MGTGNSKENWRQSSFRSASASSASASPSSSSWASQQSYPQYGAESYNYPPTPSYAPPPEYAQPPPPLYSTQPYSAPPSQSYGSDNKKRLERKYSRISDNYSSLEQVSWVFSWFLAESSVFLWWLPNWKAVDSQGSTEKIHIMLFHLGDRGSCTGGSGIFESHCWYWFY